MRAYSEKTVPSLIRLGTISPNASKMLLNAWYGHCCGSSILGLGPGDLDLETLHGVDPPQRGYGVGHLQFLVGLGTGLTRFNMPRCHLA